MLLYKQTCTFCSTTTSSVMCFHQFITTINKRIIQILVITTMYMVLRDIQLDFKLAQKMNIIRYSTNCHNSINLQFKLNCCISVFNLKRVARGLKVPSFLHDNIAFFGAPRFCDLFQVLRNF